MSAWIKEMYTYNLPSVALCVSAWIKENKPCLFTVQETPSHSVGVRELMPSKMP